eukprot:gb/GFBE01030059.1/.p1 GENE.gb/GFBE01030059.1/~~gb/GFBE01030059.1/.p1  ORF type:complete len:289 (+),score=38.11 gb/GFBE01030059.1/:1-867(+)
MVDLAEELVHLESLESETEPGADEAEKSEQTRACRSTAAKIGLSAALALGLFTAVLGLARYAPARPVQTSSSDSAIELSAAGQGDYWELVKSKDVGQSLTYLTSRDNVPECMQGLVWLDQQCNTYWKLPWSYGCRTGFGFIKVDEFVTGFSHWDGKCVHFSRKAWTFGAADIASDVCYWGDVPFCQTNQDTHGPCDDGAYFKLAAGDGWFDLEKTSFGWDRISSPMGLGLFHYPVLPIVDGKGRNTKWFSDYMEEVSQSECPWNWLHCRKSQWAASGQTARCTRILSR